MQLASHELQELHELTMSCVNSITSMASFLKQVQDQQLKSILQKHFPIHVQVYNMKVQYLNNANGPTQTLQVPEINKMLQSYTQAPISKYPPVQPRTNVKVINDREIGTSYLLTLKRAGREYAGAAMEAANPDLRLFLENAFVMCSHHAYEVWQWMVKMGFYPLEPAPQPSLNTLGQFYQEVPQEETQSTMQ